MDIKLLRDLQASLNADIDAYILAHDGGGHDGRDSKTKAKDNININAVKLTQLTAEPFFEVYKLGLQGTVSTGVRVAIDLGLFNLVTEERTLHDIVRTTGADETLVLRVIRMMAAVGIFIETAPNTYKGTPFSRTLAIPGCRDWIRLCFDMLAPIWQVVPEFIRTNGLRDVIDLNHNPTRQVLGTDFFEMLSKNPEREAIFSSAMSMADMQADEVFTHYPYEQAIDEFNAQSLPSTTPFIVDVGGGSGHYLKTVSKMYSSIPGRLVVQDLPVTIAAIPPNSCFEGIVHDFFKPQPIQGAKFYHLRHILHDWPDSACLEILKQLRPAFKPGFSKLLLNGYVLPDSNVGIREVMIDLNMWALCGTERNERQWNELLKKARFKITKILYAQVSSVGIIEAVLDDEPVR